MKDPKSKLGRPRKQASLFFLQQGDEGFGLVWRNMVVSRDKERKSVFEWFGGFFVGKREVFFLFFLGWSQWKKKGK